MPWIFLNFFRIELSYIFSSSPHESKRCNIGLLSKAQLQILHSGLPAAPSAIPGPNPWCWLYQKRAQKPHQMLHAHPQDLCISNMCSCVWVSSSSPNAYAALWYPASIPGRGRDSSDSSDSSTVVISSSDSESVRVYQYLHLRAGLQQCFVIVPRFLNLRAANATYFTYGICVNVNLQTTPLRSPPIPRLFYTETDSMLFK